MMINHKELMYFLENKINKFNSKINLNQNFLLTAYSDVDWENCLDERKSTSGGALFLGDSLVARLSVKKGSMSLSTTEDEYIATTTYCTQII